MRRTTRKKSSKITNKKTKYIFDRKSKILFEDNASQNSNFKMIFDEKEPFYKHTFPKGEK